MSGADAGGREALDICGMRPPSIPTHSRIRWTTTSVHVFNKWVECPAGARPSPGTHSRTHTPLRCMYGAVRLVYPLARRCVYDNVCTHHAASEASRWSPRLGSSGRSTSTFTGPCCSTPSTAQSGCASWNARSWVTLFGSVDGHQVVEMSVTLPRQRKGHALRPPCSLPSRPCHT